MYCTVEDISIRNCAFRLVVGMFFAEVPAQHRKKETFCVRALVHPSWQKSKTSLREWHKTDGRSRRLRSRGHVTYSDDLISNTRRDGCEDATDSVILCVAFGLVYLWTCFGF